MSEEVDDAESEGDEPKAPNYGGTLDEFVTSQR
jgi:hypothetical protein